MSEHHDKRSRKDRKTGAYDSVQGEGDYQAGRRFRAQAEERGRDRSRGDDAADPEIMYPGRKPDANR